MKIDDRIEKADNEICAACDLMNIAFDNIEHKKVRVLFSSIMDKLKNSYELIGDFLSDPEDTNLSSEELIKISKCWGVTIDEILDIALLVKKK
ncbi:hypothetical protein [Anaerosphaera multitolerans]|uniref:Uncharacterized protein n=1 Tax=Anaerosphaera multitolerans TaxID=2487351 RepID=A0A437S489_9FIRM|nr:hypothetical protein [Anaerosphaera multitolerans]RVU53831.1 hypothetical protein EF514_10525 [Anaerosphaera multitolerans]